MKAATKDAPPRGRPRAFDREAALRAALRLFWERGYAPVSVAELCQAMGVNPPSLYAAFGNKSALFLEAVAAYEAAYWEEPARAFFAEPDIYQAVDGFFARAAAILLSPDTPCGCPVVLGAVNIAKEEGEIVAVLSALRQATKKMFADRLARGIAAGQIPADTDVPSLAAALNALLEGMSLQAREGLFLCELKAIAAHAVRLLPPAAAQRY